MRKNVMVEVEQRIVIRTSALFIPAKRQSFFHYQQLRRMFGHELNAVIEQHTATLFLNEIGTPCGCPWPKETIMEEVDGELKPSKAQEAKWMKDGVVYWLKVHASIAFVPADATLYDRLDELTTPFKERLADMLPRRAYFDAKPEGPLQVAATAEIVSVLPGTDQVASPQFMLTAEQVKAIRFAAFERGDLAFFKFTVRNSLWQTQAPYGELKLDHEQWDMLRRRGFAGHGRMRNLGDLQKLVPQHDWLDAAVLAQIDVPHTVLLEPAIDGDETAADDRMGPCVAGDGVDEVVCDVHYVDTSVKIGQVSFPRRELGRPDRNGGIVRTAWLSDLPAGLKLNDFGKGLYEHALVYLTFASTQGKES